MSYQSISIIVAVKNASKTLQICIDSIRAQTYPDKELIVIDGGSSDGTLEIIKKNSDQINHWVSESDKGIYNAWNKGLEHASGDWIYFLGADDFFWDRHVLERVSSELSRVSSDTIIAYGQVMLVDSAGGSLYPMGEPWANIKQRFRQVMCIPHQGVFHRSSLFKHLGNFNDSFRIAGDYEMLLRYLKANTPVFFPGIIVAAMRLGGLSSNPKNTLVTMREFRVAQKINGVSGPSPVWVLALCRVYIRLLLQKLIGQKFTNRVLDWARGIQGLAPYWTRR